MRTLASFALALFLTSATARADEAVPAQLSLLVMLKVLTYDQNFAGRGDGDFVVLVPHSPAQAQALTDALEGVKAIAQTKIQNRPLRFVPVPLDALAKAISEQKPSAFLLLPGSSDAEVSQVASASHDGKLYTLSLDPNYVQQKAALGVVNKDGRPQVVINLGVAKDVGINFPTSVLKIARTYQ